MCPKKQIYKLEDKSIDTDKNKKAKEEAQGAGGKAGKHIEELQDIYKRCNMWCRYEKKEPEPEPMLNVMVPEICSKLMSDTKPQILARLESTQ